MTLGLNHRRNRRSVLINYKFRQLSLWFQSHWHFISKSHWSNLDCHLKRGDLFCFQRALGFKLAILSNWSRKDLLAIPSTPFPTKILNTDQQIEDSPTYPSFKVHTSKPVNLYPQLLDRRTSYKQISVSSSSLHRSFNVWSMGYRTKSC